MRVCVRVRVKVMVMVMVMVMVRVRVTDRLFIASAADKSVLLASPLPDFANSARAASYAPAISAPIKVVRFCGNGYHRKCGLFINQIGLSDCFARKHVVFKKTGPDYSVLTNLNGAAIAL